MKSFQERTEIIRGMIAQRMRQSPCSEDISFTTLQTWPELLIWGFPEGMIFNIIVSCDLELKKGYDLQQAIQAVESNEESQPHEFPDRHLINYIKYRLQKEYPQYVYLYNVITRLKLSLHYMTRTIQMIDYQKHLYFCSCHNIKIIGFAKTPLDLYLFSKNFLLVIIEALFSQRLFQSPPFWLFRQPLHIFQ